MNLQELLQALADKIDSDYANRVNDAAWVDGVWNWDNALEIHREGKAVLAKVEEVRQLAAKYEQVSREKLTQ
jgi:hypothetical protein